MVVYLGQIVLLWEQKTYPLVSLKGRRRRRKRRKITHTNFIRPWPWLCHWPKYNEFYAWFYAYFINTLGHDQSPKPLFSMFISICRGLKYQNHREQWKKWLGILAVTQCVKEIVIIPILLIYIKLGNFQLSQQITKRDEFLTVRVIMLFNRDLPTRCQVISDTLTAVCIFNRGSNIDAVNVGKYQGKSIISLLTLNTTILSVTYCACLSHRMSYFT